MKLKSVLIFVLMLISVSCNKQTPIELVAKGYEFYEIGNYTEAVELWTKAAEQGHADAQINLGGCYAYGEGVEQSYTEAVKWFHKAANQGNASAQSNLGRCYYYGYGVKQNKNIGVKWFRNAANQENKKAIEKLKEIGDY